MENRHFNIYLHEVFHVPLCPRYYLLREKLRVDIIKMSILRIVL